jgi:hypothetical protein
MALAPVFLSEAFEDFLRVATPILPAPGLTHEGPSCALPHTIARRRADGEAARRIRMLPARDRIAALPRQSHLNRPRRQDFTESRTQTTHEPDENG